MVGLASKEGEYAVVGGFQELSLIARGYIPRPLGRKKETEVLVEYPTFECNEKVKRLARGLAPEMFIHTNFSDSQKQMKTVH